MILFGYCTYQEYSHTQLFTRASQYKNHPNLFLGEIDLFFFDVIAL